MSDYDGSMNRAKRVLHLAHDKGAKSEREGTIQRLTALRSEFSPTGLCYRRISEVMDDIMNEQNDT
jgi:hypothetical protein